MPTLANLSHADKVQRAFDGARSKIKIQMSAREFKRFEQVSSLNHLVEEGNRIGEDLKTKMMSTSAQRISKLASRVEPFSLILQGFCKLSPAGGDLIWGIVTFLLVASRSNLMILEEVLEFFVGMAEEIKHLTIVEDTFNDKSHILGPAVEAIYVAIINFWVKAMQYYMDKLKSDILSRIKTWLSSSSAMFSEFVMLKSKIASQKVKLHELEASLYHADGMAERSRRQQEEVLRQQRELSDFISPPDYEHHFRTAKQYCHDGTCEWLRSKHIYKDWLEGDPNKLLVIYGTAGVGKTVLSSWLVDELHARPGQHFTIYHFFKETDDSCNTALSATRSLLDQVYEMLLSTKHPLLESFESQLTGLLRKKHVHFATLWNVFSTFLTRYSQRPQFNDTFAITVLLDAMDECKDSNDLIQCLRSLIFTASNNIQIVITSRPGYHQDETSRPFPGQSLSTTLKVTQDDVEHDIAAVAKSSVENIDLFREPKLFHLRDRIIAEFSDPRNHQGMFLWTFLMCQEVRRPLSKAQILNLLKNLPRGLNDTYMRICERLSSSNESNPEFSRCVLQWVVASRRPMTFAELEEALKLTSNNGDASGKDFFDENGNLFWSRTDVVKCCGDLVRYSGLDEGDTIDIVHLSAQQFLSSPPMLLQHTLGATSVVIAPYLVDIPSTEMMMATACVKYLLSSSPHSNQYYSHPIPMHRVRNLGQETFKKHYPFFDYATTYWTEYATSMTRSQPVDQLQQLIAAMTEFFCSPISTIWLEELIHLTYIEYAQHAVRRLAKLEKALVCQDILEWLDVTIRVLIDFANTLSLHPHVLRIAHSFLNIWSTDRSAVTPLETDLDRCRVYYDPPTDKLYSLCEFYLPTLRCQFMQTGERFRPMLVSLDGVPEEGYLEFQSAAVSPSKNYIAAGYLCTHLDSYTLGYLVLSWSINISGESSSFDNWATLVFSEFTPANEPISLTNPLVQFVRDNIILMPHCGFDLQAEHFVGRMPRAIRDLEPDSEVNHALFSGDGQRVAWSRGSKLVVLNIHGTPCYRHVFDGSSDLHLQGFSHSGCKAVIRTANAEVSLFCVVVDEARSISMAVPSGGQLDSGVFTKDEWKFVARVLQQLAVWTFPWEEDGSYGDHADIIYVFESSYGFGDLGFVFHLVPGTSEDPAGTLLVVEASGKISKQSLDLEVPSGGERMFLADLPLTLVKRKDRFPELSTWSVWRRGSQKLLKAEKWLLQPPKSTILVSLVESQLPPDNHHLHFRSPDGRYLATEQAIIDTCGLANGSSVPMCVPSFPGVFYLIVFNIDETLFACLCQDEDKQTLYVLDVSPGPEVTQRASFVLEDPRGLNLIFSKHHPTLLAVCNYVMRLEDHHLAVVAEIDEAIKGFSECGKYYYDWHYTLYGLPDGLIPEEPLLMELTHLGATHHHFYPPHLFELHCDLGLVYLQHRLVPESNTTRRNRIIWVVPDVMLNKVKHVYLIWPDGDTEDMSFLIVLEEGPTLIDIGIKRGDLMKEGEWLEHGQMFRQDQLSMRTSNLGFVHS